MILSQILGQLVGGFRCIKETILFSGYRFGQIKEKTDFAKYTSCFIETRKEIWL